MDEGGVYSWNICFTLRHFLCPFSPFFPPLSPAPLSLIGIRGDNRASGALKCQWSPQNSNTRSPYWPVTPAFLPVSG